MCQIAKILFCSVILSCVCHAQPWVMFNDMDDTYLYDQASGQVYVRAKKGGKNYEDTFVKMGIVDSDNKKLSSPQKPQTQVPQTPSKLTESQLNDLEEQQKLLRQAQELQKSIQGSILDGGE